MPAAEDELAGKENEGKEEVATALEELMAAAVIVDAAAEDEADNENEGKDEEAVAAEEAVVPKSEEAENDGAEAAEEEDAPNNPPPNREEEDEPLPPPPEVEPKPPIAAELVLDPKIDVVDEAEEAVLSENEGAELPLTPNVGVGLEVAAVVAAVVGLEDELKENEKALVVGFEAAAAAGADEVEKRLVAAEVEEKENVEAPKDKAGLGADPKEDAEVVEVDELKGDGDEAKVEEKGDEDE